MLDPDPTLGIEEIARRIGYGDPASFTPAFRKWSGHSPSAFRRISLPVTAGRPG